MTHIANIRKNAREDLRVTLDEFRARAEAEDAARKLGILDHGKAE
ncbi:hypothetical protein ACSQ76_08400 [Roseovarius sp. B08]